MVVDSEFDYAAICLDPKGDRKSMLDPSPAVIRKETPWLLIMKFDYAAICLDPKGNRKSMLDPSPAVIRKETPWLLILTGILSSTKH